ncbi:NAD(P)H-dependent oxidoreductase [Aquisalimonas lutea]|uniref:NADPH-dependent FMN reductase n=1 Tax=Aquisalimonas lutea TaxID=1327750 RepID=UPI0025B2CABE|nr:NAD(P)H-dependent oxidoreductase [Aquisalimonas lutea]MDN3519392.1 NAD(P)H-dependent oxidoreductase [Aquisalimonas lutea]
MQDRTRIAVIYGSTREGRLCDTVAGWVVRQALARPDFEVDVIDPAGRASHAGTTQHAVDSVQQQVDAADGFIVVTPEYNHSYPAPLKALIDSFKREWQAKPVAFVSYGGGAGGTRAVEHLRQVFTELHAVGIRDGVIFPGVWSQFDDDGEPVHRERAEDSARTMLARLAWWTLALRDARAARDYEEAA